MLLRVLSGLGAVALSIWLFNQPFIAHPTSTFIFTRLSHLRTEISNKRDVPLLNRFNRASSGIPRFLIDADHPWIEANRPVLEKMDVKGCLLESNSPLRSQVEPIPADLFKNLSISNDRSPILGTLGWQYANMILEEMASCPAALDGCESLKVDIYRHVGEEGELWEPATPPKSLVDLFIDVLGRMPNLEELVWKEAIDDVDIATSWREGFHLHNTTILAIKSLSIGLNMDFLVPMCPSLRSLSMIGRDRWAAYGSTSRTAQERIVRSAGGATKLVEFSMDAEWDPELVEVVLESMPQLRVLRMKGRLEQEFYQLRGEPGEKLRAISQILSRFPHLSTLEVPDTTYLGLGFDGGAWCGNAYFGLDGTRYGRYVTRTSMWADEFAANAILKDNPHLERLSLGGGPGAKVVDGQISWPWTGRIREYLLEAWPRYRARPGREEYLGVDEDPEGSILDPWQDEEIFVSPDWSPGAEFLEDVFREHRKVSGRVVEEMDDIEGELWILEDEAKF